MFKPCSLLLITTIGLTACANDPIKQYVNYTVKQIDTTHAHYSNQLITNNQPYATIKIYPFVSHFGYALLDPEPVNIKQVDDKVVFQKNTLSIKYELITPFWELKVPVGTHRIIMGGMAPSSHFQFSMNFEQGKKYVINLVPVEKESRVYEWRVYEYEHDSRFNNNEKESIILKQEVKLKDTATVTWKEPKK